MHRCVNRLLAWCDWPRCAVLAVTLGAEQVERPTLWDRSASQSGGRMSHAAEPGERSEATRFLSIAAYLDEDYRRLAVDELVHDPFRAVAPSYGVDVAPVLAHCLVARRWMLLRDGAITVLWLIGAFVAPAAAWPLLLVGLPAWWVYQQAHGALRGGMSRLGPQTQGRLRLTGAAASVLVLVAGAAVFLTVLWSLAGQFLHGDVPSPVTILSSLAFPALLVLALFAHRLAIHRQVVEALQPEAFSVRPDPAVPEWCRARVEQLRDAQRGNVAYVSESRADNPFVGSGEIVESSSFAVPLRPRRVGDVEPRPLTGEDVYEGLRRALIRLSHQHLSPEQRIDNLTLRDRLYVHGRLRPTSPYLVDGRPTSRVAADVVERVSLQERGAARRFLVARVAGWEGELETSVFFYAAVRGDMLYLEVAATLLPPVSARYHAADSYEHVTGAVIARHLGGSVLDLLRVAPGAPVRLWRAAMHRLARSRRRAASATAVERRLSFDYGSRFGLRELGVDSTGWFALSDADEVRTLLMRRAFTAVADILAEFGYDGDEFETRANVVINNSTTNLSGASIHHSVIASGTSSQASASSPAGGASS